MIGQAGRGASYRRRLGIAVTIVALHLALLAVLQSRPVQKIVSETVAIEVRAVPAPPAVIVAAPRSLLAVDIAPPVIEIVDTVPGAPCALEQAIATSLAADPAVANALTPLTTGSARAIMVWDGSWSVDPAVAPIHRSIVATIAAADPACRQESNVGPRLVFVPLAETTISIALGSGTWSWQQLLSYDQDVSETGHLVPSGR